MFFNIKLFNVLATKAYERVGSSYTLDETLKVFRVYFQAYENYMRAVHPNIRTSQIESIISKMPYLDDNGQPGGGAGDIDSDSYQVLIEAHFKTNYGKKCDYNINHFFAGEIRLLRLYENLY